MKHSLARFLIRHMQCHFTLTGSITVQQKNTPTRGMPTEAEHAACYDMRLISHGGVTLRKSKGELTRQWLYRLSYARLNKKSILSGVIVLIND